MPNRTTSTLAIFWCAAALTAGCGSNSGGNIPKTTAEVTKAKQQEDIDPASIEVNATVDVADPEVLRVAFECAEDAKETCNAVDDNCDGRIDEDCGFASGPLQITMGWNTQADLDLVVTDPVGESISNQNRRAASGGELDHDARGGCRKEEQSSQIENALWRGAPMKGTYDVSAHYWGECSQGGTTTVTVSVAASGKSLGVWNTSIEPGDNRKVIRITVR